MKRCEFNICPENSEYPGYCTEKIFHALEAGCIPIYWGVGPPEKDIINRDKYIFVSSFDKIDFKNYKKEGNVFNENANFFIKNFYNDLAINISKILLLKSKN